jgi:hypothetical protein
MVVLKGVRLRRTKDPAPHTQPTKGPDVPARGSAIPEWTASVHACSARDYQRFWAVKFHATKERPGDVGGVVGKHKVRSDVWSPGRKSGMSRKSPLILSNGGTPYTYAGDPYARTPAVQMVLWMNRK